MARARVHSRDLQPQLATPRGLLHVPRVQRFDWPATYPTTPVDELSRKLHVGTTTDIPDVTVTVEAFDVTHNTFAYLTGYTPATFPASGASVTDLKNIDAIGQIRDSSTLNIVNALYVKRGIVTGIDASFEVRGNSTVSYTISSNSKKEYSQPVRYESKTVASGSDIFTLSLTPSYLTRTSGYVIDSYKFTPSTRAGAFLDEGTGKDFTVNGATLTFSPTAVSANDIVWVTYCNATAKTFENLDDASPAAIQGKYVPLTISVSNIPRVQSATIRAAFASEAVLEMGGLGKPVGYEIGIPDVTGDISVLKTDNALLSILEAVSAPVENDLEFAKTTLPLKIQLKDPRNPGNTVLTYYVPSITITAEGDEDTVNQGMNETFSWQSTTGELIIMSGVGVY